MHASDIAYFIRDGESWVRFTLRANNGKSHSMEEKLVRHSRIKKKRGGTISRPVVMLDICMGAIHQRVEVNLANRSNFIYPLLIGRNFLIGHILIDSGALYTDRPRCAPRKSTLRNTAPGN